jgi:hypothetical protein
MKVVNIEILPAKDGEVVTAVITEETQKGGSWKEGTKTTVQSGTPEAKRSLLLDEDDRVIIEGRVEAEVIYDPVQGSASRVYRGEKAKEEEKKDKEQKEKFEKMEKEEKERLEKEKPQEAKLREEQQKARDEKIMGKQPEDAESRPNKPTEDRRGGAAEGRVDYRENEADRDAGLRTETPTDSRTVKNEASGSTTKPAARK